MQARETDQNPTRIAELVAAINEGSDLDPIVLVDTVILDGHHRARAYATAGATPVTISLSTEQYNRLKNAGYDDMEIAGAAHWAFGTGEGTENLNRQFAGAGLFDRAVAASELL